MLFSLLSLLFLLHICGPLCLGFCHGGIVSLTYIAPFLPLFTPQSIRAFVDLGLAFVHFGVQKYPSTLLPTQKPFHLVPLNLFGVGGTRDPALDLPRLRSCVGFGLLLSKPLLLSYGHYNNGFTPLPISSSTTTLLTIIPHLINGTNVDHNPNIGGIDS